MPPELLGPTGLLVGLGLAVVALWRDHLRSDADVRTQRDTAIAGWKDQQTATNLVAAAATTTTSAVSKLADVLERQPA